MNESSYVFEVINKTVKDGNNRLSVKELCKTAWVSRSSYYAWLKAASVREATETQDRRDFVLILEAYKVRGLQERHREHIHKSAPQGSSHDNESQENQAAEKKQG